ncbi:MAG: hypothetical protein HYU51_08440 [Candidatus Rokubacteria bacterium]|nr:hypothetical protein [Candidatus Rokubacteria bacterium]
MESTPTRRRRPLGLALVALGLLACVVGAAFAETLGEAVADLTAATREYQESLAHLLALQEQDAVRAETEAERYRTLFARGLVSRRDVETAERAAAHAREQLDGTRGRMAEAERVVAEAEALLTLAALPPTPVGEERATPEVVEYRGPSRWTLDQVASLERFFAQRFGRALPVSALGQTALHDRFGFDHRNALDIAVHPDSPEGRALLQHLRSRGVPFLAFRGAVPGISTGAHVHVGAPSPRKS